MGFSLMIKRELVHHFLMGLRVFKIVGEKSLHVNKQVYDLIVLLFVWCCLLANKFTRSIVIILNPLCIFSINFGHTHELGFMRISC